MAEFKARPVREYKLTSDCGPHCGIDGFSEHKRVGHCEGCHSRTCRASQYDRTEAKISE